MDIGAAEESGARSDSLAERLLRGEEAACEELWLRFGAKLHGYAAARLGEEGAEDVVVQALAAVARGIRGFNPRRATFSAWLYGVTRRVIQAEVRKRRRSKSVPAFAQVPLDSQSQLPAASPDLTAQMEARRQVRDLAAVLSEAEMEVLVLHFVDELSVPEIAEVVGRSRRAADSLLHRAKRKARERLADDGA